MSTTQFLDVTVFATSLITIKSLTIISAAFCVVSGLLSVWQTLPMFFKLSKRHAISAVLMGFTALAASLFTILFAAAVNVDCVTVVKPFVGVMVAVAFASKQFCYSSVTSDFLPGELYSTGKTGMLVDIVEIGFAALFFCLQLAGYVLSDANQDFFGTCVVKNYHVTVLVAMIINSLNSFWFGIGSAMSKEGQRALFAKDKNGNRRKLILNLVNADKLFSIILVVVLIAAMSTGADTAALYPIFMFIVLSISSWSVAIISTQVVKLREQTVTSAAVRIARMTTNGTTGTTGTAGTAGTVDGITIDLAKHNRIIQTTCLLACMAMLLLALVTVHVTLASQTLENTRINIAGAQRMLSQRMVLECYESVFNDEYETASGYALNLTDKVAISRINTTLATLTASNSGLLAGDVTKGLTAVETDIVILRKFAAITGYYNTIHDNAAAFAAYATAKVTNGAYQLAFEDPIVQGYLEILTAHRLFFLTDMDLITSAYQDRSNSRYKMMIILQALVFAGSMITILIQFSILMKPSYGKNDGSSSAGSNSSPDSEQKGSLSKGTGSVAPAIAKTITIETPTK